jgi:hypothetical protein
MLEGKLDGRARAAGHARRAHPRRRRRHPAFLHADRRRHAVGRARRSARSAAASTARARRSRRLRDRARVPGRHEGNLVFRKTARNFNPIMATAAKVTIVEASTSCRRHARPDRIHTPAIYVPRIFQAQPRKSRSSGCGRDERQDARPAGSDRAPRGTGARGADPRDRLLREPRDRHADADREPRAEGHPGRPAERERHARRRPVSRRAATRIPT